MKLDPNIRTGDLLTLGGMVAGIAIFLVTVRGDVTAMAKDIARHEVLINKLTDVESQMNLNQTKIAATLEVLQTVVQQRSENRWKEKQP